MNIDRQDAAYRVEAFLHAAGIDTTEPGLSRALAETILTMNWSQIESIGRMVAEETPSGVGRVIDVADAIYGGNASLLATAIFDLRGKVKSA